MKSEFPQKIGTNAYVLMLFPHAALIRVRCDIVTYAHGARFGRRDQEKMTG